MAVKEMKNGKASETENKRRKEVSPPIHETGGKERAAEESEEVTRHNHMRSILKQYYNY